MGGSGFVMIESAYSKKSLFVLIVQVVQKNSLEKIKVDFCLDQTLWSH